MSEISRLRGSERYGGCEDDNQQELIEKLKRKELGLPAQAVLPEVAAQ